MTRIIPARLLKVGPLAAAVAVAVLSLVLAACGSSSTASSRPAAQASGASAPATRAPAASAGTVDKTKTQSPAPAASGASAGSPVRPGEGPCSVLPASTFGAILGTAVASTSVSGDTCWIHASSNPSLWKASVTYQPVKTQIVDVLKESSQQVGANVYSTAPGIYLTFLPSGMEVGVSLGLNASCNPTQDAHQCVTGDSEAAINALAALSS